MSNDLGVAYTAFPPWLMHAVSMLGVREVPGVGSSPEILAFHAVTTLHATSDETAWCAAALCWCLEQAGIRSTRSAAAIDFENWGVSLVAPRLGCIAVYPRKDPKNIKARHVGLWIRSISKKTDHVIAGNHGDCYAAHDQPSTGVRYRWPGP